MKMEVKAPTYGAHAEADGLGLGTSYSPQRLLVMYAVLLGPEATFGCGPFAPGVCEILAVDLHCVVQVPRSEERRTC